MQSDYRRTLLAFALAIPLMAAATEPSSPLVDKVRAATERFKNINVALADGFVQGTPCVSGPDFGAMGVHFVMAARINGGVLAADQPEALIYEPQPVGSFADWNAHVTCAQQAAD